MKLWIGLIFIFCFYEARAESLGVLLKKAYDSNPEVLAEVEAFNAEDSLTTVESWLGDPMIGVSTLDRGSRTTYGVISQKIRFPVKYFLKNKAQENKALAQRAKVQAKKFEVRKEVVATYYSIFSHQKIIQLTEANMQSVRDFSRVAERKYAAGKAPQSDSMKAHFELTRLELDLMRMKQEEENLQLKMRELLNDQSLSVLSLSGNDLSPPSVRLDGLSLTVEKMDELLREKSPRIQSQVYKLEEAKEKSALSKWEFAPDIQLQYQKRLSGQPEDSEIFSVGLEIPLWFWNKGAKASAARSQKTAQEYRLKSEINRLLTRIKDLKGKVNVGTKTLKIYRTSLIPQAQGAFNSSKAAYRANKTTFLDLLDSERSLFRVKMGFYQSLQQFVENLTALEAELGFSVSDIEKNSRGLK